MIAVLAQAARPTARAIAWRPVAGALAALLGLSLLLSGEPAGEPLARVGVALAASVVLFALADRAEALLAAVPVPVLARRGLRILLVAPAVLGVLLAAAALWQPALPAADVVARTAALVLAGTVVLTWTRSERGALAASVLPLAWVGADWFVTVGGPVGDALGWWRTDSVAVALVSVVLVAIGARR